MNIMGCLIPTRYPIGFMRRMRQTITSFLSLPLLSPLLSLLSDTDEYDVATSVSSPVQPSNVGRNEGRNYRSQTVIIKTRIGWWDNHRYRRRRLIWKQGGGVKGRAAIGKQEQKLLGGGEGWGSVQQYLVKMWGWKGRSGGAWHSMSLTLEGNT